MVARCLRKRFWSCGEPCSANERTQAKQGPGCRFSISRMKCRSSIQRSMPSFISTIPFDTADPRRNEPLVRLETAGVAYEAHHARTDGRNWPYFGPVPGARKDVWLRETVAGMLANVNDRLKPFCVDLIVSDGYRKLACQDGMWDFI